MSEQNHDQYVDLLTYVLLHAAEANNDIAKEEQEILIAKAGHGNLESIKELYYGHSEEQRKEYIQSMRDKWLMTDNSKGELMIKIRELFGIDNEIDFLEKAVYEQIKTMIYTN